MAEHDIDSGGLTMKGTANGNHGQLMKSVAEKIEEHGEVHASFDGVEGEVELRLGTTRINYDANTFDVWDGETYQSFSVYQFAYAYKPMGVMH